MSHKQNELDDFFSFGESIAQFDKLIDQAHDLAVKYLVSDCCGASVLGELDKNFGRCKACLEMAPFVKEAK